MTTFLRRAALVLVAAAVLAPAAHAALPYETDITVSAKEQWTYKQRGYPKTCASWIFAKGTVSGVAQAAGPLIFSSIGGFSGGGLSLDATQQLDVKRVIDFKVHESPITPPCAAPCAPHTELGDCAPQQPKPDASDRSTCAPPSQSIPGLVRASIKPNGMLIVEATSKPTRAILLDCTSAQLLLPGVPLGTPETQFKTITFPGAAARIRRLKPGAGTTFRKSSRSGSGCPATKAEMQACTTYTTIMKVHRRKG